MDVDIRMKKYNDIGETSRKYSVGIYDMLGRRDDQLREKIIDEMLFRISQSHIKPELFPKKVVDVIREVFYYNTAQLRELYMAMFITRTFEEPVYATGIEKND